ncbi:adenylate/guanylate cyclase domain-containing protein [Dongia deserti]|uniref:adenylate/guanylate cyclase domain-containing protein n=1 Tax=Dongia deserti TaxID=2268030 RepID=UPI000E65C9AB|nr:adenylate/guanylate cyclase domain-containing protein [Dongia deserti]
MDEQKLQSLAAWITEAGLAGGSETEMLAGFCERASAVGLPLVSGLVVLDILHPTHEGHAIRWYRDKPKGKFLEYERTNQGEAAENWRRSVFFYLLESGEPMLHERLTPETVARFTHLVPDRQAGMTDFVGILTRFAPEGSIGEMDCIYSAWYTDREQGFEAREIAAIRRLEPFLALAIKSVSLGRVARTLAETYLGRDAAELVLSGRIERGVADRIEAVVWFSDLSGYTKITDSAPPEQIIPLLNDYAEVIVSAIRDQGGDVLKLIGDGVLAIFTAPDNGTACAAAIAAALVAEQNIAALNERRAADNLPTTHMYLGLHVGEMFFGNIGSKDRLDFTIVGPAVNEISRIAAMCRSADQSILASAPFAAALRDAGPRLVSCGRYALRGVTRPQELFTLDRSPLTSDT